MNSEQPDTGMMGLWPDRRLAVETNILIIAARPGDESHRYGGLIAELCRRGRPPFVTILTDGSEGSGTDPEAVAARLGAAARRAAGHLGLPAERMLLVGLHATASPGCASAGSAAMIDALVSAYDLLSWARDCQTVCVPGDTGLSDDHKLARILGERLSARAGLCCVLSFDGEAAAPDTRSLAPQSLAPQSLERGRIDVRRHLAVKARAQAEYPATTGATARDPSPYEHFAILRAAVEPARFWVLTTDQDRTSNMRAGAAASSSGVSWPHDRRQRR